MSHHHDPRAESTPAPASTPTLEPERARRVLAHRRKTACPACMASYSRRLGDWWDTAPLGVPQQRKGGPGALCDFFLSGYGVRLLPPLRRSQGRGGRRRPRRLFPDPTRRHIVLPPSLEPRPRRIALMRPAQTEQGAWRALLRDPAPALGAGKKRRGRTPLPHPFKRRRGPLPRIADRFCSSLRQWRGHAARCGGAALAYAPTDAAEDSQPAVVPPLIAMDAIEVSDPVAWESAAGAEGVSSLAATSTAAAAAAAGPCVAWMNEAEHTSTEECTQADEEDEAGPRCDRRSESIGCGYDLGSTGPPRNNGDRVPLAVCPLAHCRLQLHARPIRPGGRAHVRRLDRHLRAHYRRPVFALPGNSPAAAHQWPPLRRALRSELPWAQERRYVRLRRSLRRMCIDAA